MLCIERFGFALIRSSGHQLVPPMIAAWFHPDIGAGSLIDNDFLDWRTRGHRFVDGLFERDLSAAPIGTVLGDHRLALCVVDSINERIRREASEDNRVGR